MKIFVFIFLFFILCSCGGYKSAEPIEVNDSTSISENAGGSMGTVGNAKSKKIIVARAKIQRKKTIEIEHTDILPSTTPHTKSRVVLRINNRNDNSVNDETILNSMTIIIGDINYVIQDTMIVGVINEVNMTISKGVNKDKIISEVKTFNRNNLHTDSIRISPVMKARLVDPSNGINFRIVSKTNEEQFIEEGDYTRWIWNVINFNLVILYQSVS